LRVFRCLLKSNRAAAKQATVRIAIIITVKSSESLVCESAFEYEFDGLIVNTNP